MLNQSNLNAISPRDHSGVLSFDQDLRHAFTPLSKRLERGVDGIDKVIEILRLRIQLEAEFAKGISQIIETCDFASNETGSIRDALNAIKADMENEVRVRTDFVDTLKKDVYKPLIERKDLYNARNIKYVQDTKANIKSLRSQQAKWIKIKEKYDKAAKEAQEARCALLNAQSTVSVTSQQVVKLGEQLMKRMKTVETLQEKYDSHRIEWTNELLKFDDGMTTVLQGMESNEEARLNGLSDSLCKWTVYGTNLAANRSYDIQSLVETMSEIDVEEDLQNFMRETLNEHPIRRIESVTPRNVYQFNDNDVH